MSEELKRFQEFVKWFDELLWGTPEKETKPKPEPKKR